MLIKFPKHAFVKTFHSKRLFQGIEFEIQVTLLRLISMTSFDYAKNSFMNRNLTKIARSSSM